MKNPFVQAAPEDTYVIAEIGKGFIQTPDERPVAEYLQNAVALVGAAADAGADAVKFQTHEVSDEQAPLEIVSSHFKGADRYAWVTRNTNATPVKEFWAPLIEHCAKRGITFFTTPMSRAAAQKLAGFDLPFWKVGSGDVQDYVLLDYLISTKKPIIISSGMVSLRELDEVMAYVSGKGATCAVLYCISKYPAPAEYFNLSTIEAFKDKYPGSVIGFSDHSLGYDIALASIKVGARIIEKHFSFSRELWGSDHKVSMTPEEMAEMVRAIRAGAHESADASAWYGRRDRELEGAHNEFRPYFNKTLVAARDLPQGAALTRDMIYAMRPQAHLKGLAANRLEEVLGKVLARPVGAQEPLTLDLLS
jgi:sialic acid synthase SpsE